MHLAGTNCRDENGNKGPLQAANHCTCFKDLCPRESRPCDEDTVDAAACFRSMVRPIFETMLPVRGPKLRIFQHVPVQIQVSMRLSRSGSASYV